MSQQLIDRARYLATEWAALRAGERADDLWRQFCRTLEDLSCSTALVDPDIKVREDVIAAQAKDIERLRSVYEAAAKLYRTYGVDSSLAAEAWAEMGEAIQHVQKGTR